MARRDKNFAKFRGVSDRQLFDIITGLATELRNTQASLAWALDKLDHPAYVQMREQRALEAAKAAAAVSSNGIKGVEAEYVAYDELKPAPVTCPDCYGTGEFEYKRADGVLFVKPCPACSPVLVSEDARVSEVVAGE